MSSVKGRIVHGGRKFLPLSLLNEKNVKKNDSRICSTAFRQSLRFICWQITVICAVSLFITLAFARFLCVSQLQKLGAMGLVQRYRLLEQQGVAP